MLNKFLFQMIIQVHMHRNSFFIWLLIVLWIFNWVSLQIVLFSDFMCSSKFYYQTWSYTWIFVFYLHDILVILVHRTFHFITSQSICLFDQQNYSCQFVAIILSWNHVHWFQFMIQIQFVSSVYKLCRTESHSLIHSSCYSW